MFFFSCFGLAAVPLMGWQRVFIWIWPFVGSLRRLRLLRLFHFFFRYFQPLNRAEFGGIDVCDCFFYGMRFKVRLCVNRERERDRNVYACTYRLFIFRGSDFNANLKFCKQISMPSKKLETVAVEFFFFLASFCSLAFFSFAFSSVLSLAHYIQWFYFFFD